DDYLIIVFKNSLIGMNEIKSIFLRYGKGLNFKHEYPVDSSLQFLDLTLNLKNSKIEVMYNQRSKKALLSFTSEHSKLVKRSIVKNMVFQVVTKSSCSTLEDAWNIQLARLVEVGYPKQFICNVAKNTLEK